MVFGVDQINPTTPFWALASTGMVANVYERLQPPCNLVKHCFIALIRLTIGIKRK
jgi:hypothetical protein